MLPRRKPKKSGIKRAPERSWRKHGQWVRGFACVAMKSDPNGCAGKTQLCHYRSAANSGTAVRPADWWTFPACEAHHTEQHAIGQPAFERKHGVKLEPECLRLARISPDKEMRAAMREAGL